jgi:hypothetical protein
MKEFAHPDRKEMAQVDINQAISSTLVIATNEYNTSRRSKRFQRVAAGQLLRGRDQPGGAQSHRERFACDRRRGQGHDDKARSAWRPA